jgi:hypothetical protein
MPGGDIQNTRPQTGQVAAQARIAAIELARLQARVAQQTDRLLPLRRRGVRPFVERALALQETADRLLALDDRPHFLAGFVVYEPVQDGVVKRELRRDQTAKVRNVPIERLVATTLRGPVGAEMLQNEIMLPGQAMDQAYQYDGLPYHEIELLAIRQLPERRFAFQARAQEQKFARNIGDQLDGFSDFLENIFATVSNHPSLNHHVASNIAEFPMSDRLG